MHEVPSAQNEAGVSPCPGLGAPTSISANDPNGNSSFSLADIPRAGVLYLQNEAIGPHLLHRHLINHLEGATASHENQCRSGHRGRADEHMSVVRAHAV